MVLCGNNTVWYKLLVFYLSIIEEWMNEYGSLVECKGQGNPEIPGDKPATVIHFPLALCKTRASAVTGWWLTARTITWLLCYVVLECTEVIKSWHVCYVSAWYADCSNQWNSPLQIKKLLNTMHENRRGFWAAEGHCHSASPDAREEHYLSLRLSYSRSVTQCIKHYFVRSLIYRFVIFPFLGSV